MLVRRSGFTLIELLLVLVMSALLMAIGMRESQWLWNEQAVDSAAGAVAAVSHNARSEAMREGVPVYVWIRPTDGVVRMGRSATDVLDSVVMSDYHVTMTGRDLDLCYTARGYAMSACTTVGPAPEEIAFTRADRETVLTVLPLGQMWRD